MIRRSQLRADIVDGAYVIDPDALDQPGTVGSSGGIIKRSQPLLTYAYKAQSRLTMDEQWYTVEQVAERLRVTDQTVRSWLRRGTLRGQNLGGRAGYRIPKSEITRVLVTAAQQVDYSERMAACLDEFHRRLPFTELLQIAEKHGFSFHEVLQQLAEASKPMEPSSAQTRATIQLDGKHGPP